MTALSGLAIALAGLVVLSLMRGARRSLPVRTWTWERAAGRGRGGISP